MKKIIVLFLLLLIFLPNLLISDNSKFGLLGGCNFSSLSKMNKEDKSKMGIFIGGFVEYLLKTGITLYPSNSSLSIESGLNFITKGFRSEYETVHEDYEQILYLNYLQIPLLCKYSIPFNENNNTDFYAYISTGPALDINVYSKYYDGDDFDNMMDFDSYTFILDYILSIGINFENFIFEFRYDFGLTDISKNSDSKNKSLILLIGYSFDDAALHFDW